MSIPEPVWIHKSGWSGKGCYTLLISEHPGSGSDPLIGLDQKGVLQSILALGTIEKRKEDQPSSSSGKRHKTYAPRVFQGRGRGYQGQGQTRASTQLGSLTCFHCHQLGYVRRDCPHRQGSQGFGTTQSQSSVG